MGLTCFIRLPGSGVRVEWDSDMGQMDLTLFKRGKIGFQWPNALASLILKPNGTVHRAGCNGNGRFRVVRDKTKEVLFDSNDFESSATT